MSLKIGIGLFTGQIPPGSDRTFTIEYREMLELVRRAEALGFDSAWLSEHHGSSDGYLPSLLAMLAALASVTERIELGTGVVLTPFHDPIRLAEDAAVVDQLSGGRLILGLGVAWREEEFRMFGVPRNERARRTEETIHVLRRAWTGERFSFEGTHFRYDRVKVSPPAARDGGIPIYLGGYDERAVRRAGRLADGHISDAEPDDVRAALAHLSEGARSAGRDPMRLALALMQNAFVVAGGDAYEPIRTGVGYQLGAYEAWDERHDTPDHDSLEPFPLPEDRLRRWTFSGTPAEVTSRLRPLAEEFGAGRDLHLIVRLHYPGMDLAAVEPALELFGAEVLPALRVAEPT